MPPSARVGLVISRASIASLNVVDLGLDSEGFSAEAFSILVGDLKFCLGGAEVEGDVSVRDDTGFIKSLDIDGSDEVVFGFADAVDEDVDVGSTI
jgi:hypothetical protein